MRLNRSIFFWLLLVCLSAGALHGQVLVTLSTTANSLQAGQTATLQALVTGSTNTAVTFSQVTVGTLTAGTAGSNGITTATYRAPASITSAQTIVITVASVASPSSQDSVTITLQTASLTVSPATVTLGGAQIQQFVALQGGAPVAASWAIAPLVGSIDANGLYSAPLLISGTQTVNVSATVGGLSATAKITLAVINDVGSGAPTTSLQLSFVNAFFRNGFNNLVSLPPVAAVKKLGATGYVQEFNDAAKTTGVRLALATASVPLSGDGTTIAVVQLLADLYGYYATVGANTAGLPLYDTQSCPLIDGSNSCTYDIFDKNYALFAYHSALATGQNFTIRNTFYTEWTARGGITGLGRPVDVETAVTASTKTTATTQAFINGAIFTVSSGVNNGKTLSVLSPIYDLYVSTGGPGSTLGLPSGQEIILASGVHRQNFEGGILEYTPGSGGPVIRVPVTSVVVTGAPTGNTITLNLGDSLTLRATPTGADGAALPGRPVSWSTTNSRAVSIEVANATAVIRAVGSGQASVTATSEGVVSTKLNFTVITPCCQVGDGAPTAVQRSFQDALTRNKIAVQLPVAGPAVRVGGGYVQTVQASGAGGVTYWVAQGDRVGTAFVLGGALLDRYGELGGPAGTLGYPIGDRTSGGTQRFENSAALAGNPVRLVAGGVLAKWALLNYEAGVAGAPTGDAAAFSTFGANSGAAQAFAGGAIYVATAGPRSGQAYFVTGPTLARYNAIGGAGADFGMPVSDEFVTSGVHQQNFEGGNITWSAGDAAATDHAAAKTPGVVVAPAALTAGGKARLAIVGFPSGSTLRVSVTGQPDFLVITANGAYSWEMFFPLATKSGAVAIHAVDTKGGATADGSLVLKGFNDTRVAISMLQGDNQTGLPGSLLPFSLRVALRDAAGDPVTGAAVTFEASSGAKPLKASAVTDAAGQAETFVRLQSLEGVALVRVDAAGIASAPVTFGLRSAASTLSNFPKLQQAGSAVLGNGTATIAQKGALLTAVASILRYHQNRSELGSPNGAADPASLNLFLKGYCPADSKGVVNCDGFLSNPDSREQVVNLWRAADFAGGADLEVYAPSLAAIADLIADGSPVLLSLAMTSNGTAAGGHFVVATGVAADGSIVIQDPNPLFARSRLNDYLNGFSAGGAAWKATLVGVARYALQSPAPARFLVAAISQPASLVNALALEVTSAAGACGQPLDLLDAVDGSGNRAAGAPVSRFTVCDGAESVYQLRVGAAQPFHALIEDLATAGSMTDLSGNAAAAYKLTRPKLNLAIGPQETSFAAASVVNGATFMPGIAPGGVVSIFGTGLTGPGKTTTVDMDGTPLRVLFATPFQINAEVPPTIPAGIHTLSVQSAYGPAQQQVPVSAVAPGIFLVGNPPSGAITNPSYALVGPANPLARGQVLIVFATGLGAVTSRGGLSVTSATVTVVLNGTELPVQFAGLAPGFPGLYQVNVAIPPGTPPGLSIPLTLKVGGQISNTVLMSLQ